MGRGRSCVPSTAHGLAEVGTEEEANVKQPRENRFIKLHTFFLI